MHPVIPVLQLLNAVSRVEGRKKMQKTVHILQEMGAPFKERFEYSYYGMFSAQLKGELEALEKDELVKESLILGTPNTYVIETLPKSADLLKEIGFSEDPSWIKAAKHLNTLQAQVLEGVSTILFLQRTEKDEQVIRQNLLVLKPHLEQFVDNCFAETKKLPQFV